MGAVRRDQDQLEEELTALVVSGVDVIELEYATTPTD